MTYDGQLTREANTPAPTLQRPEGLLAHYTTAEVAFEHVLPSGKLRLSRYGKMRDPAENKDILLGMGYWGERTDEEAGRAFGEMLITVKEIRDSMRVLSLTREVEDSRDTFGCCWTRPRMWEQYGDVHRGACLVFDGGKLRNAIQDQMPEPTSPHEPSLFMGSVRYTRGGIANSDIGGMSDENVFDSTRRREAVARYIDAHYEDFYLLKTDDWTSEHEYRVILRADGSDPDYASVEYRDALVAVVVGERFPRWQLAGARGVCDDAGVPLRRMHWEKGRPFALSALPPNG